MYVPTQSLAHLSPTNICNGVQRQTIEQLIMTQQILSYAIHYQMKQLMLFVQKQRNSQVSDLLLTVLVRTDQIDSLEVSEVDVPS